MRVLLVEDDQQLSGMCARELSTDPYRLDVTSSSDPRDAVALLGSASFDAAVVDLLYTPFIEELRPGLTRHGAGLAGRSPLVSGLSVAAAAQEGSTRVVVWTSVDLNRRLHLRFAYEELGVRAFCSKRSGNGTLRPLYQAIRAAAHGRPYSDAVIDPYLPTTGAFPLGQTLFAEEPHRPIWRALALGHHTMEEISQATGYRPKTVRNLLPIMYQALRSIDHGMPRRGKPQAELIRYATANQYFLLDDTVRQRYPW